MAEMNEKYTPRLKVRYKEEIAPALMKKFTYKSVMQIPKLDKITLNVGCGEARDNAKVLDSVVLPTCGGSPASSPLSPKRARASPTSRSVRA